MPALRSYCLVLLLSGSIVGGLVGCGASTSDAVANRDAPTHRRDTTAETAAPSPLTTSPAHVVSQFLDLVRRGGQTEQATSLLTSKAQSELKRIGRSVQPIGSPDAQFEVTRFELVPSESSKTEKAAMVHCVWTEPSETGVSKPTEVVWAVQQQSTAWRISGLAMVEPGQEPIVINFEDGNRMAAILANSEPETAPAEPTSAQSSNQASANDDTLSR